MNGSGRFIIDAEGALITGRGLVGLGAAGAAQGAWILAAGATLIACVWLDAVTGYLFRRCRPKSASNAALETFADATCFVAAPIEFIVAMTTSHRVVLAVIPLFFLAAVYRLARFEIEGLAARGRYAGLPVTYNGYIFPTAGAIAWVLPTWTDTILVLVTLVVSALMVSRRLSVPEF